jgi:hypothetical protein
MRFINDQMIRLMLCLIVLQVGAVLLCSYACAADSYLSVNSLYSPAAAHSVPFDYYYVSVVSVDFKFCQWKHGYERYCGVLAGRATASPMVLQVSDIHTSQFQHSTSHRERHEDFQIFTALVAPRIRASAAVLTGDLVDSKSHDSVSSYQSEWEWKTYRNVTDVLLRSLKPTLQV